LVISSTTIETIKRVADSILLVFSQLQQIEIVPIPVFFNSIYKFWLNIQYSMPEDEKPKSDLSQQYLANERTFLAWVRTCIALIGLGFIISKFSFFLIEFRMIFQNYAIDSSTKLSNNNLQSSIDDPLSSLIGIGIVILSCVLILFALKNYRDTFKAINVRDYKPKNTTIYITTAIIIALTLIMVVYLLYISNSQI
jgi:putative membrane protein